MDNGHHLRRGGRLAKARISIPRVRSNRMPSVRGGASVRLMLGRMAIAFALVFFAGAAGAYACVGNAECDDQNPCTIDSCVNLSCAHAPVSNGVSCADVTVCNGAEVCQAGACVPGAPLDCNDQNPCTDDICDPNDGCHHANNSQPCSDGNDCTSSDTCNGATCVGGNRAAGCTACQAVATIPADGGVFVGATSGTSSLAGSCGTSGNSAERVYQWTPVLSGTATIETCGSGTTFDTVLYVRNTACATGAQVACNDATCPSSAGISNASRVHVGGTAR